MKRNLKILLIVSSTVFLFSACAFAMETGDYEAQLDSLTEALDEESRETALKMGISAGDYSKILSLDIGEFFRALWEKIRERLFLPMNSVLKIILVSVFCAAVLCFEEKNTSLCKVTQLCGVMCACIFIIAPISEFVSEAAKTVSSCTHFMLTAIPAYSALLYAGGQTACASSYSYITLFAGNVISVISNYIAEPMLNVFLALSVVSGISENFPLSELCDFFAKTVKTVLTLGMTVFTAILGVQSFISLGADAVTLKTAKFAASAFVPAVGSAVSDAMTAIYSSIKLLRSGAGAFGILAALIMFVPPLMYCAVWKFACVFSAFASNMLRLKKLGTVIKSAEKALDMAAALMISSMAFLIIMSAVVLSARGSV